MAILNKSTLLGLLTQTVLALAAPGSLELRTECSHNNCLRAVIASNAQPGPSSASKDCVSYFQKTVTSTSTSTTVVTSTVTSAVDAATTTVYVTATETSATDTEVDSAPFTTVVATQDVTNYVTISVASTVTQTLSATVTSTTTSLITSTVTPYYFTPTASSSSVVTVLPREAPTSRRCGASPPSADIPSYASACSDVQHYSSACSCIGITGQTVTASLPVVTSTVLATAFVTPTAVTKTGTSLSEVIATVTVTTSLEVDATATSTVVNTVTVALDPVTAATTTTQTNWVTITSTTVAAGPTQNCMFNLIASGGTVDGQSIYAWTGQNSADIAAAGSTSKTLFQLDAAGKIRVMDGTLAGQTFYQYSSSSPYVDIDPDATIAKYSYKPLICTIDPITLVVLCHSYSTTNTWKWNNGYSNAGGAYLWLSSSLQSPSVAFNLLAVPVQCTD